MRCPQCSRFVSYGEQDPEVTTSDIRPDNTVEVDVRVVLPCADCSTELKDYEDKVEFDLEPIFDFTILPQLCWGEFKIFNTEYYARRSHDPEANEWIIAVFRIEHPWVSGPRDTYGRPDYEHKKAVYGTERKFLVEYKMAGTTIKEFPALIDVLLEKWAMPLWNKERFDMEEEDVEFFEDSKGSGRYTQMFYGANFKVKVTDNATGKEHLFEGHVQEQASSFNECC